MRADSVFRALNREAQFTKEMLGAGATQIRKANYATKGIYFQAFSSLSTGLERIGKLCLMLDHYISTGGTFPDLMYMKKEIGHRISLLYERSIGISVDRGLHFDFQSNLADPVHQAILTILSQFAQGDRYSNVDILVGRHKASDPVSSWYEDVDLPLYEARVSSRKKERIEHGARLAEMVLGNFALVRHTSETEAEIDSVEEASYRTGVYEAVAPYRQLCVLQIIRFWVELLSGLQSLAMALGRQEIPFFTEVFAPFYNPDSYLRTRKTWDKV